MTPLSYVHKKALTLHFLSLHVPANMDTAVYLFLILLCVGYSGLSIFIVLCTIKEGLH